MDFVPKSASFAARQLNFSRSRFRIETQGSKDASPNQSITFQLPENALLDLKSFRIHANVSCSCTTPSSSHFAKAPADFSSLIASFSVFVGGVCVSQSNNDYAEVCRIVKLIKSSLGRDNTIDTTLSHGKLSGATANDDFDVAYTPTTGMFDSSTRYFPSMLTGSISIMITFKSDACLTFMKSSDKKFDDPFMTSAGNDATELAIKAATYAVKGLYATIDTINMDSGLYEAMLLDQINRDEAIKMVYKEFLTFRKSNIDGSTAEHTLALSSSSVDVLYTVFQNSNFNTNGIPGYTYSGVSSLSDAACSNQLFFTSCNGASTSKVGGLKYQYFINNVPQSSFQSNVLDAAADLSLIGDRTTLQSNGHMITSLADFQTGKAIYPCILNMQENPSFVRTGYSCRGSNSSVSVSFTGLTAPSADDTRGIDGKVSMLTVAECSQVMHIKGGRQLQIEY